MALIANLLTIQEPLSFSYAKQDSLWVRAMDKELVVLKANETWVLTSILYGHKAITTKGVYKFKSSTRQKVQWKGLNQG